MLLYNKFIKINKMKLGKHAVKVLAVFAVLFVVGFALKFLNLHEGFFVKVGDKTIDKNDYNKRKVFLNILEHVINTMVFMIIKNIKNTLGICMMD